MNSIKMLDFINQSPTAFQAIEQAKKLLDEAGFQQLQETTAYQLEKGKNYYIVRNDSGLIAFKVGDNLNEVNFQITASHVDAPAFKIKPKAMMEKSGYQVLNTEVYGGPIINTWFDRPLSIAGRVMVKDGNKLITRLIDFKRAMGIIPNLAIHINHDLNTGYKYNLQKDTLPLVGYQGNFDLNQEIATELNIESSNIVASDLYLYPMEKGIIWGKDQEFISSYHLDDLQCAYTTLMGFIAGSNPDTINVCCLFDNEEVGSSTMQGANSTYLRDILKDIADNLKLANFKGIMQRSYIVSADNAHAMHPNYSEKLDPTNHVYLNEGIVIKHNANQRYSTDAKSAAIFKMLCELEDVKVQDYTNRSDVRGGSTLGALSISQVSIHSIDIGLAQLAMHSTQETAGCNDTEAMIKVIRRLYNSKIRISDGGIEIK